MKILYGVQATGNGHISRAHAMAKHLPLENTQYVFTGRKREDFFDMEKFGDWECLSGLSFAFKNGKISNLETLKQNHWLQFFKDVAAMRKRLKEYDVVVSDFEPVSAWAAKLAGKPCIGIGHQYAFDHAVPKAGNDFLSRKIMQNFAPVSIGLGLHWHHFDQNILPPIVELHEATQAPTGQKPLILVYLGFEAQADVVELLAPFKDFQFAIYGPFYEPCELEHLKFKPASREGFHQDLHHCEGVICNAGFELASEAITLGKKLLVKPLQGQTEQESNARALYELDLGIAMDQLQRPTVDAWLQWNKSQKVHYPDVAKHIVNWLQGGNWDCYRDLSEDLWQKTSAEGNRNFITS
ncbi:MJ1255/VC2487 family glycosyltransferase [uncultured Pseudoteredinibacter sp.]|uniref:MJ1255/VC2487 family glycosyltransferase n=1 Tax=uncultured Pseudoteredinibacter sp. TaxID=1641701 RepID=UPI002637157E|nr:MJ1255/VC2487 family glycosyltransferase [uncultured Pseudoteredinibacter sp.]